jgi:cellulose synthase/poly-beta-1,6-N-acetylglucosamine synthase-like glycosyltransferase
MALETALLLTVACTTLAFQLFGWTRPERNDVRQYEYVADPHTSFSIILCARFEERVLHDTLSSMVAIDHPAFEILVVVDPPDDPGTAEIAYTFAYAYPHLVRVIEYPPDLDTHNKPIGLNTALPHVRYEFILVMDAEDETHWQLLRYVDTRILMERADIVQAGVQLMDFQVGTDVPARWYQIGRGLANLTVGWWRVHNCLEYFKWFLSRMPFQAATGVIPLGGNTVFMRTELVRGLDGWGAMCLAEDCKVGIDASVAGARVTTLYHPSLVTREECPPNIGHHNRQRTRWFQGYLQVLREGNWRRLPNGWQRVMAFYLLAFPIFQAATGLLLPLSLARLVLLDAPVLLALIATLPLLLTSIAVVCDVVILRQFGQAFDQKVRWRDYAAVVWGAFPYMMLLALAGLRSIGRMAIGRTNWFLTPHTNHHRRPAQQPQPMPEGVS